MRGKKILLVGMVAVLLLSAGCGNLPDVEGLLDGRDSFAVESVPGSNMAGYYAFERLDETEKCWYANIYEVLSARVEEGDLQSDLIGTLDKDDVDKIFRCVLNDHPELFYVSGYSLVSHKRGDEIIRLVFQGDYTMDAEEVAIRQEQIELVSLQCLQGISTSATDYEKVKYVYEYLIQNTEYKEEAPNNQNICSVLINGESVCQGYAKTMQYLLNRMDVFCTLVIGSANGAGHAWNLVRVDGNYYYVDSTWGDASYTSDEEDGTEKSELNYDYLCVTTEQLCKTHVIDNIVPMPECTSLKANYYVREGAYFEDYAEEKVADFLRRAQAEGREKITIKCANEPIYDEFFEELITNRKIFKFVEMPGGVLVYMDNREALSLTIWLTEE